MRRVVAALVGASLFATALLGVSPVGAMPSKVGPLPNSSLTSGAKDDNVTQANIAQTICVLGYTKSVRKVSSKTKSKVYAEYHISKKDKSKYTIDHLIPLELGGGNSIDNLWPEPKKGDRGSSAKDGVENDLHALVCNGTVTLADAQAAIAADWITAGTTVTSTTTTTTTTTTTAPPPPPTTAAPPPPPPPPAPAPGPPGGATALCNDGTYSYAANHQGACSHHGGVAVFYK